MSQVKSERLFSDDPSNNHFSAVNVQEAKKNSEKPLLRRKSELPADILTQKSLENYKVH